ncbi:hypothetical protein BDV93DRAFT_523961, partial [Ceratobasidium sp. AG-I]
MDKRNESTRMGIRALHTDSTAPALATRHLGHSGPNECLDQHSPASITHQTHSAPPHPIQFELIMSLNWVMLDARKEPVPLPQERTLSSTPGAELTVHIPPAPPQGDAPSGGNGGAPQVLKATGRVWLTTERFIFVASLQVQSTSLLAFLPLPISNAISPAPTTNTPLESLSLPWLSVLSTAFTQPYFGANYLAMDVKPAPDGGLAFGTRVEVRFSELGMFEFVRQLEGVRAKAIERAREARMGESL